MRYLPFLLLTCTLGMNSAQAYNKDYCCGGLNICSEPDASPAYCMLWSSKCNGFDFKKCPIDLRRDKDPDELIEKFKRK